MDPAKLSAYGLTLGASGTPSCASNNDVGGKLLEVSDAEYFIRGQGYMRSREDIENIVVGAGPDGTPVSIRNVATVQMGGDIRRGSLEKNGQGQVVGGIVVMR